MGTAAGNALNARNKKRLPEPDSLKLINLETDYFASLAAFASFDLAREAAYFVI